MFQSEINEKAKTLRVWVRRKGLNGKLGCSGCGRGVTEIHEVYEREVRDLPCFDYKTTVVVELYRLRCPDCGVKAERIGQLPTKAPFSKRFEDAVGRACEGAAARMVARQLGYRPAPCGPSICAIWSGGIKAGESPPFGRWAWTRFSWAGSRSS